MAGKVNAVKQNEMERKEFAPDYWKDVWENIALPQEVRPGEVPGRGFP